jgi:hypothetical protein
VVVGLSGCERKGEEGERKTKREREAGKGRKKERERKEAGVQWRPPFPTCSLYLVFSFFV